MNQYKIKVLKITLQNYKTTDKKNHNKSGSISIGQITLSNRKYYQDKESHFIMVSRFIHQQDIKN